MSKSSCCGGGGKSCKSLLLCWPTSAEVEVVADSVWPIRFDKAAAEAATTAAQLSLIARNRLSFRMEAAEAAAAASIDRTIEVTAHCCLRNKVSQFFYFRLSPPNTAAAAAAVNNTAEWFVYSKLPMLLRQLDQSWC